MTKNIFAGRKNFKRDFTEYMVRMASDSKDSRGFIPFHKKKEEETYPRIFLLYGSAGSGKSALAIQFADMTGSIGTDLKKTIKTVTLDVEDIMSKNMMMLRTLIDAVYSAFSKEEPEGSGNFSEYADIERQIENVHDKVGQICRLEWPPDEVLRQNGVVNQDTECCDIDDGRIASEEIRKDKTFTGWLRENNKLTADEMTLYENSDSRLSNALVNGIVKFSSEYPLVLVLDSFNRINNSEIENWLRTDFLGNLFKVKNSIIAVISGRKSLLRNFRNDFQETLLYPINMNDFPLTLSDISEYAHAIQAKISVEDIRTIEEKTCGLPFAVRNVVGLVKDNAPLSAIINEVEPTDDPDSMILMEVDRFLKNCPDRSLLKKIIHCALMRRLESNILAELWDTAYSDVSSILSDFAIRYPFITDSGRHQRGSAVLREYLMRECVSGKDREIVSIVREFGVEAAPLFSDKADQLRTAIPSIEKRYDDERYTGTILGYFEALLWNDRDGLFKILPGIFLECLQYNHTLAVRLLQCIDEFKPLFTVEQHATVDILINGILSYQPMGIWLEIKPSAEESAMMHFLEKNSGNYNDLQKTLLYCRQGELHYRASEYDLACKKFELCVPLAQEYEGFKKTIVDNMRPLGEKLFAAGNHEAAIRVNQFITKYCPKNHQAWHILGRSQTALGLTGESVESYIKTLELKPDNNDAWYSLGIAYYQLESYKHCVEALDNVISEETMNAHAWFIAGSAQRKLDRNEEAVKALTKASELEPDKKDTWMELGLARIELHLYEDAVVSFEKVINIDGKNHEALYALGKAQNNLGLFQKAAESFEKAHENMPDNKEYLYNMASARHSAGNFDGAIRTWGKILEMDPADKRVPYRMALSLHAVGQYSDAIHFYTQAAAAMPENIAIPLNMGRAYHAQGLFNDAVEMYRMALQINSEEPEVWDDLGLVFTSMNLYGDAIQAYRELVRIAPDWNNGWYHLGNTYYKVRHYENAAKSYEKAVELDPQNYSTLGSLGLAYYTLGNYVKAVEACTKALSIKPDELWIQSNCALSSLLSGNIELAGFEYDKLILLAKTSADLEQPAAALESVISMGDWNAQAAEILARIKGAMKDK
jgi:tetratricopeptide (TPR) repeat protein